MSAASVNSDSNKAAEPAAATASVAPATASAAGGSTAAASVKKPKPAAKSQLVLDVSPYDIDTDLNELDKRIRGLVMPGVTWAKAASEKVPIAYGLCKLRIGCVIVDSEVGSIDDITEEIEKDEAVQSVTVVTFVKI